MVDSNLVRDEKSLMWVLAEHAGSTLLITHAAYCKQGADPLSGSGESAVLTGLIGVLCGTSILAWRSKRGRQSPLETRKGKHSPRSVSNDLQTLGLRCSGVWNKMGDQ